MANCKNESMEVWEQRYPLRFHRYELVDDSGGPGTWRGGLGTTRHLELTASDPNYRQCRPSCLTPPPGLFGGGKRSGRIASASFAMARTRPSRNGLAFPRSRNSQICHYGLGDVLVVEQGAAGDMATPLRAIPPLSRPMSEMATFRCCKRCGDYGVVLDPRRSNVDVSATKNVRARSRRNAVQ